MSRKSLYNKKMTVKRLKVMAQDAVGGTTQVIVSEFKQSCRIRQLNAFEQSVGGKDGELSTHRVYCSTSDIHNKDEIRIGDRVYDVNSVNPISANKGTVEVDVTLRV